MFEQPTPLKKQKSTHFCVLPVREIVIFMSVWDCKGFLSYKNEKSPWKSRTFSGGEGEIWTLAPVTRPTPLAGAPLRPLEYFSILRVSRFQNPRYLLYPIFALLSIYFLIYLKKTFRDIFISCLQGWYSLSKGLSAYPANEKPWSSLALL